MDELKEALSEIDPKNSSGLYSLYPDELEELATGPYSKEIKEYIDNTEQREYENKYIITRSRLGGAPIGKIHMEKYDYGRDDYLIHQGEKYLPVATRRAQKGEVVYSNFDPHRPFGKNEIPGLFLYKDEIP